MKNNIEVWLRSLRNRLNKDLPPGFDQRFWSKFEERFPEKKQASIFAFFKNWKLASGLALASCCLLFIFLSIRSVDSPGVNGELSELSSDELVIAMDLEILESFDRDEDFPRTEEEWELLLGEDNGV